MFQFTGFPPRGYVFTARYIRCSLCGFPHSDTCGSSCVCHSPQLFAAYRVFLRPPVPRHPPCALLRLTLPRAPSVARAACFFSLFFCVWYYFLLGIRFSRYGRGVCAAMGLSGLEPPTSRLSGVRSNRLSYKPRSSALIFIRFDILFFAPAAACFPMPSPA